MGHKARRRYLLVFQLPEDFFSTFDHVVAFEDTLNAAMARGSYVDGHDIGAGTVCFFVITTHPEAAFGRFRRYLGTNRVERKLRAAYRGYGAESDFVVLWPRRDTRPFELVGASRSS